MKKLKNELKAVIFDLDGVIVDTAKYHYLAWKEISSMLDFKFTKNDNERLKGVSRMKSLDILLEIGNVKLPNKEKFELAEKKNKRYVEYISKISQTELLPGGKSLLEDLRRNNIKTALGSASKNTPKIIEKLDIGYLFDAIIDGNSTTKAKPDPEVFLLAAKSLNINPECCMVIEDAEVGIKAALAANMYALGIGEPNVLKCADKVIKDLVGTSYHKLLQLFDDKRSIEISS